MTLAMYPDCHRCGRDLSPGSAESFICSMECTFCADCAEGPLERICPNCGGDLQTRPTRAAKWLEKYPASSERKGPS